MSIAQNNYYKLNRDKILKQVREYYLKNKEVINNKLKDKWKTNISFRNRQKEYCKLYREKNKIKLNNYKKLYNATHKEEHKQWIQQNIKHLQLWRKEYKLKNKKYIRKYEKEYRLKNYNFKLAVCLRARIRKALHGISKSKHTLDLLGCSIPFLKMWLELQFKQGMSWKNYKYHGWHVDHIRPCASFDLTSTAQQRGCFNYTNLQPLWAEDNLRKQDAIIS